MMAFTSVRSGLLTSVGLWLALGFLVVGGCAGPQEFATEADQQLAAEYRELYPTRNMARIGDAFSHTSDKDVENYLRILEGKKGADAGRIDYIRWRMGEQLKQMKLVFATDADKQLAAEFRQLHPTRNRAFLRETFNSLDARTTETFLGILEGKEGVNEGGMGYIRGVIGGQVAQMKAAAGYTGPETLTIARAPSKITVDADLSDEAWQAATPITTWYTLNKGATPETDMQKTSLRILWDEEYLYFAFEADDVTFDSPFIERDGPIYNHDCFEVFILPSKRWNLYWELEFNAAGSIMDNLCYKVLDRWGGDARFAETMEGMQFAWRVVEKDGKPVGYVMEIAVPFRELPAFGEVKPGATFHMLACRVDTAPKDPETGAQAHPMRLLTSVPTFAWFHNIACYQPVVLGE
ncbi:MAG: carbohydrate-binding family 9-like protein [Phycisphaerae bacterium]|nr:carbohydrate-binding family 9-like protein [Phycisphaerae bacterium]